MQEQALTRLQAYDRQLGIPLQQILQSYFRDQVKNLSFDLFDPIQFLYILHKILPEGAQIQQGIPAIQSHSIELPAQEKTKLFRKIWQTLTSLMKSLKIEIKSVDMPSLTDMIQDGDLHKLSIFLKILFLIMLRNEQTLLCITTMPQNSQIKIKEFIEQHENQFNISSSHSKENDYQIFGNPPLHAQNSQKQNNDLFEKIQQLQNVVHSKDQLLYKQDQKNVELQEQLKEANETLKQKNQELELLKTRISAYSQADVLFEEKDQQIHKLQNQLSESQMKAHLHNTELKKQVDELKCRLKQEEAEKVELNMQNEKYRNKYEILNIQKEETDNINKVIIQNLKDKIKSLNDKIAEQQKNIMDVLMEKENKDKEIYQLEKKLNQLDSEIKHQGTSPYEEILYRSGKMSSRLEDQLEEFGLNIGNEHQSLKKYYDILFGEKQQRCSGQLCIALRTEYVKIINQILKINNQLQSIDYFSVSNRFGCIEDQLRKMETIAQQNMKLKQKIVLFQQSQQPNKEYIQEINKLKKKLLIMKRKLDQAETQRKQQIQLLVSAFQESVKPN